MRKLSIHSPGLAASGKRRRDGFSLIEVLLAAGLCTCALLVVFSLLPLGLAAVQSASRQIAQTEIFNQIWSEVNSTPYGSIVSYPRLSPAVTYYDIHGEETDKGGAVFTVVCSKPSATGVSYAANELAVIKVQIGFHVDPTTVSASDLRVASRTFLVSRRDGSLASGGL